MTWDTEYFAGSNPPPLIRIFFEKVKSWNFGHTSIAKHKFPVLVFHKHTHTHTKRGGKSVINVSVLVECGPQE